MFSSVPNYPIASSLWWNLGRVGGGATNRRTQDLRYKCDGLEGVIGGYTESHRGYKGFEV